MDLNTSEELIIQLNDDYYFDKYNQSDRAELIRKNVDMRYIDYVKNLKTGVS